MRYIAKIPLSGELQNNLEQAFQNNISWGEFSRNKIVKQALREHLKREQAGLCAYSEISLSEFGFHLDHIKPKGIPQYAIFRFDHQNLLASAPKNQGDVGRNDLFGGHKKDNEYGEDWFISPADAACEGYFQYSPNGDIEPKKSLSADDVDRANKTIDCLGLQSSRLLVNKRRSLYQTFNRQLKFLLDQPGALQFYKNYYLTEDERGNLKPFQSIVKQIFSAL